MSCHCHVTASHWFDGRRRAWSTSWTRPIRDVCKRAARSSELSWVKRSWQEPCIAIGRRERWNKNIRCWYMGLMILCLTSITVIFQSSFNIAGFWDYTKGRFDKCLCHVMGCCTKGIPTLVFANKQDLSECVVFTPWKINMEPNNHPIEKENHLPNHHFQVPC